MRMLHLVSMVIYAAFMLFFVILAGCSTVPQILDENVLYIRSMDFAESGVRYLGTAVLPKKAKYSFEIFSTTNMDLLTVRSCARDWYGEKVNAGCSIKFWEKEKKYTWVYEPDPELEFGRLCPLELASYDAKTGANLWGYIDFDSDPNGYSLSATWHCNGKVEHYGGVSVCQNRAGNIAKIKFDTEVIVKPQADGERCSWNAKLPYILGKEFEFRVPVGSCYYTFVENDIERRKHRTTVIGYSDIVIKKGNE